MSENEYRVQARETIISAKCRPASNVRNLVLVDYHANLLPSCRFITDLNRWTIMALVTTASIHHARVLRESFYRHLTFKCFIGSLSPVSLQLLSSHHHSALTLISPMPFRPSSKPFGLRLTCHSTF